MKLLGLVQRIQQRQARRTTTNQYARLTHVDLADMGIKRYQLEANS
jgi:uncharacterized protein YjiS (DUF1127 family)